MKPYIASLMVLLLSSTVSSAPAASAKSKLMEMDLDHNEIIDPAVLQGREDLVDPAVLQGHKELEDPAVLQGRDPKEHKDMAT